MSLQPVTAETVTPRPQADKVPLTPKTNGSPNGSPNRSLSRMARAKRLGTGARLGILAILLGGLAIHKFLLGFTQTAIIQLVVSVCTFGAGGVIGLVEGIIYLTKTDEEFYQTYVVEKKQWF